MKYEDLIKRTICPYCQTKLCIERYDDPHYGKIVSVICMGEDCMGFIETVMEHGD